MKVRSEKACNGYSRSHMVCQHLVLNTFKSVIRYELQKAKITTEETIKLLQEIIYQSDLLQPCLIILNTNSRITIKITKLFSYFLCTKCKRLKFKMQSDKYLNFAKQFCHILMLCFFFRSHFSLRFIINYLNFFEQRQKSPQERTQDISC